MDTTQTALTLQADPDIAGGFIVSAPDGEILGFGDSKAEALAGARVSIASRCEARKFWRFSSAMVAASEAA